MNGGYQRSTGPPAGHSVIHKMRPFQTSLHPVVAVMFVRKKTEDSDEENCVNKEVPGFFWSGFWVDHL